MRTLLLTLTACLFVVSTAQAKYSGGTGEPNDPYQIATAADLIALGETPADYDKHFILTADIDLDPNLPGRRVFDKAVIAPDGYMPFTGVLDGKGHVISRLTIKGDSNLGLFGQLGQRCYDAPPGEVKDLGLVDVDISGSAYFVGGLVGMNGCESYNGGIVTCCYSTGSIRGDSRVGGLVGDNLWGIVTQCYSSGAVSGETYVGGLVGSNDGIVTECYSAGVVGGKDYVGGLVGAHYLEADSCGVWNVETSGQPGSAGGVGLTTAEMMDLYMLGLNGFANDANWVLDAGHDYPRLAWEKTPGQAIPEPTIDWLKGQGTSGSPYRINTADQLTLLGKASILWDKHFVLGVDIDLDPNVPGRRVFAQAIFPVFKGTFDGSGHTISNLTIRGQTHLGLFGQLQGAVVRSLGLVDVNITGSGDYAGGLVGDSVGGHVTDCYCNGVVSGNSPVGGLIGLNYGTVTHCRSAGVVSGTNGVGGLVGLNWDTVTQCCSTGSVSGGSLIGGLVGDNDAAVTLCYSSASVSGTGWGVGGLMGSTEHTPTQCYSTGAVSGAGSNVGGLVGYGWLMAVTDSFWDTETSGQTASAVGTGKTTAEMKDPNTFRTAGWDFVGQPDGPHDIWAEPPGGGYPILWWELSPLPELPRFSGGTGERDDPYHITTPVELNAIGYNPRLMARHFELVNDMDLADIDFYTIGAEFSPFTGSFRGCGHRVSHLTVSHPTVDRVGLFGYLGSTAEVKDVGVVEVNITDLSDFCVGGLARHNRGTVACCYTTGAITGFWDVGGLVGANEGTMNDCYSMCTINGRVDVGGLVGWNYSGTVKRCYSSGAVSGKTYVGGLVADDGRSRPGVVASFWDIETSHQATSGGGIGKTTAEMQTAKTFLDAGWDFVGETANGTDDIWWILEGKDYPRLWWEAHP